MVNSKYKFAAFLRGINVGGRHMVKMADVNRVFSELGFENIKSFLQSGNIVFDSDLKDDTSIIRKLETAFRKKFGFEIPVLLRRVDDLRKMFDSDPFKIYSGNDEIKKYVLLLGDKPRKVPSVPFVTSRGDAEIISIVNSYAFIICRKIAGRFGFPNNEIEKQFDVTVTSRNWNTIIKMLH